MVGRTFYRAAPTEEYPNLVQIKTEVDSGCGGWTIIKTFWEVDLREDNGDKYTFH